MGEFPSIKLTCILSLSVSGDIDNRMERLDNDNVVVVSESLLVVVVVFLEDDDDSALRQLFFMVIEEEVEAGSADWVNKVVLLLTEVFDGVLFRRMDSSGAPIFDRVGGGGESSEYS